MYNVFGDLLNTAGKKIANSILNKDKSNATFIQGLDNLFTGNLDYQRQLELQEKQQAFNASEAQKTRDWNLELANSAYQRQAQDLKAAGFNPALMLGSSGASGYTSATASSSSGSSGASGSGWKMLAQIGLSLATKGMSALALSNQANANLSNAINAREYLQQMLVPHTWNALGHNQKKIPMNKQIEQKYIDQDWLNSF